MNVPTKALERLLALVDDVFENTTVTCESGVLIAFDGTEVADIPAARQDLEEVRAWLKGCK